MKIKEIGKKISILLMKFYLFWLIFSFSLSLLVAGGIYFRVKNSQIEFKPAAGKIIEFDQKTFEKILEIWQKRNLEFQKIEQKEYPNHFGE